MKKFFLMLMVCCMLFLTSQASAETNNEFNEDERDILIAKYERDLNIYDFDSKINWQTVYETSQKLSELDALNPSAFRAAMYYFRKQENNGLVVECCNRILNTNRYYEVENLNITKDYYDKFLKALKTKKCPADTVIEAYFILGDMYYNAFDEKAEGKKFVDDGIEFVKKIYSKDEIEKFVNGTEVKLKYLELAGKSNTVRELYVLKSEIEDCNPTFKSKSKMKDLELEYDIIYDLKYKTDW